MIAKLTLSFIIVSLLLSCNSENQATGSASGVQSAEVSIEVPEENEIVPEINTVYIFDDEIESVNYSEFVPLSFENSTLVRHFAPTKEYTPQVNLDQKFSFSFNRAVWVRKYEVKVKGFAIEYPVGVTTQDDISEPLLSYFAFSPSPNYSPDSEYEITLYIESNGVKEKLSHTFNTVQSGLDEVAPEISQTYPQEGRQSENFYVSGFLTVNFSEYVNPDLFPENIVVLEKIVEDGFEGVEGKISFNYSAKAITFQPHSLLDLDSDYRMVVKSGYSDFSGNIGEGLTLNFSTLSQNTEPLKVLYSEFSHGEKYMSKYSKVSLTFSRDLDQSSIAGALAMIDKDGNTITFEYEYVYSRRRIDITFLPDFPYQKDLSIKIDGLRNIFGIELSGYQKDFRFDGIISQIYPSYETKSFPVDQSVWVQLNYPINEENLAAGFKLTNADGDLVSTTITYDPLVNKVFLDPTYNLSYETNYKVVIDHKLANGFPFKGEVRFNTGNLLKNHHLLSNLELPREINLRGRVDLKFHSNTDLATVTKSNFSLIYYPSWAPEHGISQKFELEFSRTNPNISYINYSDLISNGRHILKIRNIKDQSGIELNKDIEFITKGLIDRVMPANGEQSFASQRTMKIFLNTGISLNNDPMIKLIDLVSGEELVIDYRLRPGYLEITSRLGLEFEREYELTVGSLYDRAGQVHSITSHFKTAGFFKSSTPMPNSKITVNQASAFMIYLNTWIYPQSQQSANAIQLIDQNGNSIDLSIYVSNSSSYNYIRAYGREQLLPGAYKMIFTNLKIEHGKVLNFEIPFEVY
ncbi:MAG: Ig-like domain-containing protein [Bacteriovoracaceae bacterium]|jgi:hypothetical protein|nr:Ig-like domain-containing protein [Bacteriovoracaceae bacterium]